MNRLPPSRRCRRRRHGPCSLGAAAAAAAAVALRLLAGGGQANASSLFAALRTNAQAGARGSPDDEGPLDGLAPQGVPVPVNDMGAGGAQVADEDQPAAQEDPAAESQEDIAAAAMRLAGIPDPRKGGNSGGEAGGAKKAVMDAALRWLGGAGKDALDPDDGGEDEGPEEAREEQDYFCFHEASCGTRTNPGPATSDSTLNGYDCYCRGKAQLGTKSICYRGHCYQEDQDNYRVPREAQDKYGRCQYQLTDKADLELCQREIAEANDPNLRPFSDPPPLTSKDDYQSEIDNALKIGSEDQAR